MLDFTIHFDNIESNHYCHCKVGDVHANTPWAEEPAMGVQHVTPPTYPWQIEGDDPEEPWDDFPF